MGPGLFELAGAGLQNFLSDLDSVAFVEVGPITIDPQYGQKNTQKRIRVDLKKGEVARLCRDFNPSCQQIASSLISRQESIRDAVLAKDSNPGKYRALMRAKGKKVGVCINASRETTESVPYLTHLDFVK